MTRMILIPILSLVVLGLGGFLLGQTPLRTTQDPNTKPQARTRQVVHPAKLLVKKLPNELKGIELRDGKLALQRGYKFVKEPNNTIFVARLDGSSTGTSLGCSCSGPGNERITGACIPQFDTDDEGWEFFSCRSDPWNDCSGWCLGIGGYTGKQRVPLAIFKSTPTE